MHKYQKFIFPELPKASVVNTHEAEDFDLSKDEIINHAVSQHLTTLISDEAITAEEEAFEVIDVEAIKKEAYEQGFADAKHSFEPTIKKLQAEFDLAELLQQKLLEIAPISNADTQLSKLAAQILSAIASEIHLLFPANFEQIIMGEILPVLKKAYKEGSIQITVNPEQKNFVENLFNTRNLPAKIKDNFSINLDENLGLSECKVEFSDTVVEYNQQYIANEIQRIVKQLENIR